MSDLAPAEMTPSAAPTEMTPSAAPTQMTRSSRDRGRLRVDLERWLSQRVGAAATVTGLGATSANGMSSDTILFSASWPEGSAAVTRDLVARISPDGDDVPVFPHYDLTRQFDTMAAVAEHTDVPVPPTFWDEPDPSVLGAPFFVMGQVEGHVPPDLLPYTFGDNWLYDAARADQRRLQESSVSLLARLHAIAADVVPFLELDEPGDTALRRRYGNTRAWYEFAVDGVGRSALIDRTFAWLDRRWPSHEGDAVLSWGDSRIGNVMYRDFEPVAVLDWEMAAVGPCELDIAWMTYSHRVFDEIAKAMELPGMPEFLRRDDVATTYESLTGHTPRHLDWYSVFAAVQWAIVFTRTGRRAVHFGEREAPEDIDELIMNREGLEALLASDPND